MNCLWPLHQLPDFLARLVALSEEVRGARQSSALALGTSSSQWLKVGKGSELRRDGTRVHLCVYMFGLPANCPFYILASSPPYPLRQYNHYFVAHPPRNTSVCLLMSFLFIGLKAKTAQQKHHRRLKNAARIQLQSWAIISGPHLR